MMMGGSFSIQVIKEDSKQSAHKEQEAEKYFRPSSLPVLNDRFNYQFFYRYIDKNVNELKLPAKLVRTPEDTILNYFSVLREAANPQTGKNTGCGTIGNAKTPYPLAYHFLSSAYQEKLSYAQYLATFKNILHISLIKYKEIPVYGTPEHTIRYFVELETIEGSKKQTGNFVYYYGYIDLTKENSYYKISNIEFHGEDYLCAPYHGWSYDAEASVKIRYGGWCKLIKTIYPVIQKGYVKNVVFKGTDDKEYLIVFYQLTNDTDLEISQYEKGKNGKWKLTKLDPKKCVTDKAAK